MMDAPITFDIPKPEIKHKFPPGMAQLFRFKEIERPSVWAESSFVFGYGYGEPGPCTFAGREWQRDIMDAFLDYKTVIVCGPEQVGKSVAGIDIPWAWWNANVGGHSLITYSDKDTVEDVFEERLKPSVKQNLNHLWSGDDDDLRKEKLILLNGISRCASANVESDISTFPSDFILFDELAKYRSSFDVVGKGRGRQRSYRDMPGLHCLTAIVSSPKEHDDPLYNEIHKGGVLVLRYNMPCPYCRKYHELTDANIKEKPNANAEFDHDPVRIRMNKDAEYVCPDCKREIHDRDRYAMIEGGIWASDFEADHIQEGRILQFDELRTKTDTICFWFNRLVTTPAKWGFADCLSSFFAARQAGDPKAWANYWNNDMARFIDPRAAEISQASLVGKQGDYYQYGEQATVPDGAIVLVVGVDTQDNGFYFSVVGFGVNMESWRVRHDFIHCDMHESKYRDPNEVMRTLVRGIFNPSYKYADGRETSPVFGFVDEGGHRQKDIHYLSRHFPRLKPYKGSSSPNADPIKRSKDGIHFMGNTQYWSEIVQNHLESDTFHLPKDTQKEYFDQITKQYWKEYKDRWGRTKFTFISGKNDHYRDAENMAFASAHYLNLPEKLIAAKNVRGLQDAIIKQAPSVGYKDAIPGAGPRPGRPTTETAKRMDDPFAGRNNRNRGWKGR